MTSTPPPSSHTFTLTIHETIELLKALQPYAPSSNPIIVEFRQGLCTVTIVKSEARALQRLLGCNVLPAMRLITKLFGPPGRPPAYVYGIHPGCEGLANKPHTPTVY